MMVEDKVIQRYEESYSRLSNEEDSLLSAGSSPNITSPSSTSAHSGTGSSVDEGVDMTVDQDLCKRMLFVPSMGKFGNGIGNVDNYDQPIDLSLKKPKTTSGSKVPTGKIRYSKQRHESTELVIDEDRSPNLNERTKVGSSSNSPPISAIPTTFGHAFAPWSYSPRTGSVPFLNTSVPSLWNPALFMSQAARHLTPSLAGIPPFSFAPTTTVSTPYTSSSEALQQLYGQNVLAEFSRICSQAQHLYGTTTLPGSFKPLGGTNTTLSPAKSHTESRTENKHEMYARENGVTIKKERTSPDLSISRKRKFEESSSENRYNNPSQRQSPESLVSVPLGKRIRQEYKNGRFDTMISSPDSPPSMVHQMFNNAHVMNPHPIESTNRVVPKPVDFKPCRFPCNECGRTYATVGGLLKHSKTHQETETSNNFKCKTCDKEYHSLGALKMHIRTHTLPCKCHICGKAFSRTWLLQGHIRTHTGEKPYQCTVCSRAFADRSNLRAHMQTHESVKRYACTSCDRTFSRISLLNRHRVSGCTSSS